MSAQAMSWVFRSSPYSGDFRLIHLAIADVADDAYSSRFWIGEELLAARANCSARTVQRAVARMAAEGYLEVIDARHGHGKPKEYRFLMTSPPEQYAEITDREVVELILSIKWGEAQLANGNVKSAERALFAIRTALDIAALSTVASITRLKPFPNLRSEFRSLQGIVRNMATHRGSERLSEAYAQYTDETESAAKSKAQGAFNAHKKEEK